MLIRAVARMTPLYMLIMFHEYANYSTCQLVWAHLA